MFYFVIHTQTKISTYHARAENTDGPRCHSVNEKHIYVGLYDSRRLQNTIQLENSTYIHVPFE